MRRHVPYHGKKYSHCSLGSGAIMWIGCFWVSRASRPADGGAKSRVRSDRLCSNRTRRRTGSDYPGRGKSRWHIPAKPSLFCIGRPRFRLRRSITSQPYFASVGATVIADVAVVEVDVAATAMFPVAAGR